MALTPMSGNGIAKQEFIQGKNEITVSMKMDHYEASQESLAKGNYLAGVTRGQKDLVHYLFVIAGGELDGAALDWSLFDDETVRRGKIVVALLQQSPLKKARDIGYEI